MPTGYTSDVQSGKIDTLQAFAMQCAHAFGACVTMRGDPSGSAIPVRFEPSDYHVRMLSEARQTLARLEAMTVDQQQAAALDDLVERQAAWDRYEAGKRASESRYRTMLNYVEAWNPPTHDHIGLKEFMAKQLRESIDFDCSSRHTQARPAQVTRSEWYANAHEKAVSNVAYHEDEHAKEVERCANITAWVQALRQSFQNSK